MTTVDDLEHLLKAIPPEDHFPIIEAYNIGKKSANKEFDLFNEMENYYKSHDLPTEKVNELLNRAFRF